MATTTQKGSGGSSQGTGEKPSLMLFGGLAIIALLKDLLDFIGIGSIPALGTVVTLGFSFLIFTLLLVFDRSGGRANRRVAQGLVMTFFTLIEAVGFVLNFLPLQTLTIVFLYNISYRSWKEAEKANASSDRVLTKKQKVAQAQMARALVAQEKRIAANQASAAAQGIRENQASLPSRGHAEAPKMVPPRSIPSSRQSFSRQPSEGGQGADTSYVVGRNAADVATMRIREAGSRLSQAPSGSARTNPKALQRERPS